MLTLFLVYHSGGLRLTVHGRNFIKAANARLTLSVVCWFTSGEQVERLNAGLCDVISSTLMNCPSPGVEDVRDSVCLESLHGRTKRDVRKYLNNPSQRQFYVGVMFDSFPLFQNLTEKMG